MKGNNGLNKTITDNPLKDQIPMQTRQPQLTSTESLVTNLTNGNLSREAANSSPVAQFVAARDGLLHRWQELKRELAEIKAALEPVTPNLGLCKEDMPVKRGPGRSRSKLTPIITKLLKDGPLTKAELIEKLRQQGVELADKPRKTVDPVLYNGHFRRNGKLFVLAESRM
ncbi:MAG TPA: hypothetical protein VEC99_10545 [Clostridia bacterium]|nr:hypothetical protein [Clostridia bacterium]